MSALLQLSGLRVRYPGGATAVDGLDLAVGPGEAVGLVGPSGVGKTSLALAVLGLTGRVGAAVAGTVAWRGVPQTARDLARLCGRALTWVPQEPMSALNPYRRVGAQVAEALPRERRSRAAVEALLADVGLPADTARSHPHRLSGGMCQRVLVAAALAPRPELVVADEPTASLDALTRDGILTLLADLRARHGTALLVISHDRAAVDRLCDRTVELGSVR